MAWNLGQHVTFGEIVNLQRNRVHGLVYLSHCREPLVFHLTGNAGAGLAGRHVRFVPQPPRWPLRLRHQPPRAWQQIGVVARCEHDPGPEDLEDSKAARLNLAWFGQDGLVRIALENPRLECIEMLPEDAWWASDASEDMLRGELPTWDERYRGWESCGRQRSASDQAWEERRDGEGAAEVGLAWDEDEDAWDDAADEATLPLSALIRPPLSLPPVDALSEGQLRRHLARCLARLARCGVGLSVCSHLSPRDQYRVIAERIVPESRITPELLAAGWIEHFYTHAFCPRCGELWQSRLQDDELPPTLE